MRAIINAAGHLSSLGGTTMAAEVCMAINEMAARYVDITDLFGWAETEIATLTRNESACITSGAAGGLVTVVLAAASKGDPDRAVELLESRTPIKIAVHSDHWIPVVQGLRLLGLDVRQLQLDGSASVAELAAAIEGVEATLVLADWELSRDVPCLSHWVAAARSARCPVILDAAAELPPVENLWRFTRELGFDVAIFSGGKDLGGPPGTGFLVGTPSLVEACKALRFPRVSVLRPLKVGKEEVAGLVEAVRRYVGLNHADRRQAAEAILAHWKDALERRPGVTARITRDPRSGTALWLDVQWQTDDSRPSPVTVKKLLWAEQPGIAVSLSPNHELRLTSWCLAEAEGDRVLSSLLCYVDRCSPVRRSPAIAMPI